MVMKEFKVGQIWKDGKGNYLFVYGVDNDASYPVRCFFVGFGKGSLESYDLNGVMHIGNESLYDLEELIDEDCCHIFKIYAEER